MPSSQSRKKRGKRRTGLKKSAFEALVRKAKEGPLKDYEILVEPPGQEKMSPVLEEFIAPYTHVADTRENYRNLVALGAMAWSLALYPDDERKSMIRTLLSDVLLDAPDNVKKDARKLIEMLIARKKLLFDDNKRAILRYDLRGSGPDYYLNVLSAVILPSDE